MNIHKENDNLYSSLTITENFHQAKGFQKNIPFMKWHKDTESKILCNLTISYVYNLHRNMNSIIYFLSSYTHVYQIRLSVTELPCIWNANDKLDLSISILLEDLKKWARHVNVNWTNLNKHKTLKGNNFHRIFKLCNYSNPPVLKQDINANVLRALSSTDQR